MGSQIHLWLRAEIKAGERRAAITPKFAAKLVQAGFKIDVEKSETRVFPDKEYESAGCGLVPYNSWRKLAPKDALIIGLKELDDGDNYPLEHTHIFFAHCYKYQEGWEKILQRFKAGGGLLYDLEYLTHETGKRVAAFGYYAGICGSALGLGVWAHNNNPLASGSYVVPTAVNNAEELISITKACLIAAVENGKVPLPRVLITGSKGRCGGGAAQLVRSAGIPEENITLWDKEDTLIDGICELVLSYDLLINCVYIVPGADNKPFVTEEAIKLAKNVKLSVISDVSCDPNNHQNPLPIYNTLTTLASPVHTVNIDDHSIDIIAIDHLPTLLPADSSEEFCSDLFHYLLKLPDRESNYVWSNAKDIYEKNLRKFEEVTACK